MTLLCRSVEQGNALIEQRNDSFKQSASQAHAKVLELEQEKVHRTQELHELTSKYGASQVSQRHVVFVSVTRRTG